MGWTNARCWKPVACERCQELTCGAAADSCLLGRAFPAMLEHAGYCEWKRTSVLPRIRELQSMETDVVTAYHDLCPHDARPLGERFGTTTTETDNGSLANNGYNPSLLDGCHADSHMALQKCLQPRPFLPHSRALPIINLATTKQNGWP